MNFFSTEIDLAAFVPFFLLIWAFFSFFLLKRKIVTAPSFSFVHENTFVSIWEVLSLFSVLLFCLSLLFLSPLLAKQSISLFSSVQNHFSVQNPLLATHIASSFFLAVVFHLIYLWISPKLKERIVGEKSILSLSRLLKGLGLSFVMYPFFLIIHAGFAAFALSFSHLDWHKQVAFSLFEQARNISYSYSILLIGTITGLAPLIEEFLFRGVLYSALESIVHPLFALLVSAALFAFMHFSLEQGSANYAIIATLFIFGLVSTGIKKQERSLAASVGFHMGFNALSILFALIF